MVWNFLTGRDAEFDYINKIAKSISYSLGFLINVLSQILATLVQ